MSGRSLSALGGGGGGGSVMFQEYSTSPSPPSTKGIKSFNLVLC